MSIIDQPALARDSADTICKHMETYPLRQGWVRSIL